MCTITDWPMSGEIYGERFRKSTSILIHSNDKHIHHPSFWFVNETHNFVIIFTKWSLYYTECTNMFKHDDMAKIVIRGSSPWSPSALPWPFSPPPNFSSIAALLVQIGSHFLSFWQQLWVACCGAVQTKSSWSFFPLDPQQSRCCLGIKELNTFVWPTLWL